MCLMKELVTTQSLFSTSFVHKSSLDTSWDHLRRALKNQAMLFYYPQVNPLLAHYIYRTYLQKNSCTKEDRKSLFSDRKWRHVVCAWYSSLALMFKISRHKARGECQVTLPYLRSICIYFLLLPACSDKEKSPLEASSSHLFWVDRKWYS